MIAAESKLIIYSPPTLISLKNIKKVVLSPHYDDFCFSLSGFIKAEEHWHVINIFSQCNHIADRYLKCLTGEINYLKITAIRDQEDIEFFKLFDGSRENLGLKEATLRGSNPFDLKYLNEVIGELSKVLVPRLNQISAKESSVIDLYCPMGIGGHIDHLATLLCIRNSLIDLSKSFNFYIYEDLPYASNPTMRQKGLSNFSANFHDSIQFLNRVNLLNDSEKFLKSKFISIYRSQHESEPSFDRFSIAHNGHNARFESVWSLINI